MTDLDFPASTLTPWDCMELQAQHCERIREGWTALKSGPWAAGRYESVDGKVQWVWIDRRIAAERKA